MNSNEENKSISPEEFNKMKAEQIIYNICMDKLERIIGEDFKLEISNPRTPEQMVQLWNLENEDSKMFCAKMSVEEIFDKYGDTLSEKQKEILKKHWEDASQAKRGNELIVQKYEESDVVMQSPSEAIGEDKGRSINYFTPSIKDIHVGYYLEFPDINDPSTWIPYTIRKEDFNERLLQDCIRGRVPYLTKEQIEKEGWTSYKGDTLIALNKGDFYIWYSEFSKILSVDQGKHPNKRTRFIGECRCINDFRKICKLLNIN